MTISAVLDDFGDFTGDIGDGGSTDDQTPTLTLTFGEIFGSGHTVEILREGSLITTLSPTDSTSASFEDALPAVDGAKYEYSARMIDAAGNVGESDSYTITLLLPVQESPSGP